MLPRWIAMHKRTKSNTDRFGIIPDTSWLQENHLLALAAKPLLAKMGLQGNNAHIYSACSAAPKPAGSVPRFRSTAIQG